MLVKWALWADLQVSDGASVPVRFFVSLLTSNGEGLDPAYVTTLVPLFVIPAISLLTTFAPDKESEFRMRLASKPDLDFDVTDRVT